VPGRRGRKAAAAIVLSLLALGGVSACRNDAGAASYVGDTKVTQDYVNNAVNSVGEKKLTAAGLPLPQARTLMAQYATFNDLAAKYAKEKGYDAPPPDVETVANAAKALDVPESNLFVQTYAQGTAWTNFLLSKQPNVAATDADYHQVYDELVKIGALPSTTSYESVKSQLAQAVPNASAGVALSNDLNKAAKRYDITINPRYAAPCTQPEPAAGGMSPPPCGGLSFPLGYIQSQSGSIPLFVVRMGGTATPAVFDIPTPQASATAPAAQ
jgi:hypothetical protein